MSSSSKAARDRRAGRRRNRAARAALRTNAAKYSAGTLRMKRYREHRERLKAEAAGVVAGLQQA